MLIVFLNGRGESFYYFREKLPSISFNHKTAYLHIKMFQ